MQWHTKGGRGTASMTAHTHTVDSMKGIGGERGRGGVHTKPESPVLVHPTRGSVVEVHWGKRQEKINK